MRVRLMLEPARLADLKPGELFSLNIKRSEEEWNAAMNNPRFAGEALYMRTNAAPGPHIDRETPVVRITPVRLPDDNDNQHHAKT